MAGWAKARQNLTCQEKELEAHQDWYLALKGLGQKRVLWDSEPEGIYTKLLQTHTVALANHLVMGPQLLLWAGPVSHRDSSSCGIQELCSEPP